MLLAWRFAVSVKAPYHHGSHSDPEYAYLLNSLAILKGNPPGHYDHPGTTVQLIGAGVICLEHRLGSPSSSAVPVTVSVLTDPERYLERMNACLAGIAWLVVVILSMRIFTLCGTAAALCFQVGLLGFFEVGVAMTRVSPEPLLVCAALVVGFIVLPLLLGREEGSGGRAVGLGLACGFGVATKLVFLPVCLSVLLLRRSRPIVLSLAVALGSVVVLTLPIALHYRALVRWVFDLATHDGRFGLGARGLPGADALARNGLDLLRAEPFLPVSVLLCAVGAALRRSRREPARAFVVGGAILVSQWLVTAKHPSPHYLLPSLALGAVLLSVAYETFRRVQAATAAVVVALLLSGGGLISAKKGRQWIEDEKSHAANAAFLKREAAASSCRVISYYGSSSQAYALSFGNDYSSSVFAVKLGEIYGRELFYNIWRRTFYSFQGPVPVAEVRSGLGSGCYLMDGRELGEGQRNPDLVMTRRDGAGDEVLYALKGIAGP